MTCVCPCCAATMSGVTLCTLVCTFGDTSIAKSACTMRMAPTYAATYSGVTFPEPCGDAPACIRALNALILLARIATIRSRSMTVG